MEEKAHGEEVLPFYERVQRDDLTIEQILSTTPSLLLRLMRVCWDIAL